ncbi:MAG: D-Glucosaminate-6-phosphate ammonia-lyase [uncultured Chloroflexi bacterium]|uniref:D-Glucosaminate-6-phosphate ammonia-lyase n=1 Tax=uncultured Chloroflexota bacterium TaxID=166587 RepID=A0A6J4JR35_9CHLR|nr:MAG: D-Glucosaminate-6-phosphate ammonia-lyase [uncultured Chloroflexota bacterium]
MTIYERLGVKPVINGAATLTRLGGSLMPPPVVQAMAEAAGAFVRLDELHEAAGQRLAELTRNEGAYVTTGAAAGLVLATAACVTGMDAEKMALLPRPERIPGGRYKVVVFRSQRNGYDFAVRQVGIELVEIGPSRSDAIRQAPDPAALTAELGQALDKRVACVVYFAGALSEVGSLPLAQVVELAHAHQVPVVVDAAAQIPPIENLWAFSGAPGPTPWAQALASMGIMDDAPEQTTPAGADLAVFSGGKGLRGPQASGLVVGRADLIAAMRRQGSPNAFIGRPMKVGKEEICGLVAAVEWSLAQDCETLAAQYERQVRRVVSSLSEVPGLHAERGYPNEAGQPFPRAVVRLASDAPLARDELQAKLLAHDPPIELSSAEADGVYVNPQTLDPGQEEIVVGAIRQAVLAAGPARSTTTKAASTAGTA